MYSVTNSISVVSELIGSIVKHAVSAASKCNGFATTAVFIPSWRNGLASAVNIRLAKNAVTKKRFIVMSKRSFLVIKWPN